MGDIRERRENGGVVLSDEQKELLNEVTKQSTQNNINDRFKEKDKAVVQAKIQEILEINKKESIEAQVAIAVKQAAKAIDQIQNEIGRKLTEEQKIHVRKYLLSGEKTNPQQAIIDRQIQQEKDKLDKEHD